MDFSGIAEWLGTLDAGAVVGALVGAASALVGAGVNHRFQRRRDAQAKLREGAMRLGPLVDRLTNAIRSSSLGQPAAINASGWAPRNVTEVFPLTTEVQNELLRVDLEASELRRRASRRIRRETGDLIARVMLMERQLIVGEAVTDSALDRLSTERLMEAVFGAGSDVPGQRWHYYVEKGLEAPPPVPVGQPWLALPSRGWRRVRDQSGGRG